MRVFIGLDVSLAKSAVRSLGPHHGATHPRADPGQKQDPAKVTTCVPTPSKYARCWCRGSAPSR